VPGEGGCFLNNHERIEHGARTGIFVSVGVIMARSVEDALAVLHHRTRPDTFKASKEIETSAARSLAKVTWVQARADAYLII